MESHWEGSWRYVVGRWVWRRRCALAEGEEGFGAAESMAMMSRYIEYMKDSQSIFNVDRRGGWEVMTLPRFM